MARKESAEQQGAWSRLSPPAGRPALVVRANDSGREGAWVLTQAERAFPWEGVCVRRRRREIT